MLKVLPWIAVLAVSTVATTDAAHADDAYICDGGRLVYARPETLEKLKQTDPCIQAFYRTAQPAASTAPASAPVAPAVPAVPTAKNKAPASKPAQLKGSRDAALKPAAPKAASPQPAAAQPASAQPSSTKPPAEAAAGTDFRNVRVINAPNGPELFRHER